VINERSVAVSTVTGSSVTAFGVELYATDKVFANGTFLTDDPAHK